MFEEPLILGNKITAFKITWTSIFSKLWWCQTHRASDATVCQLVHETEFAPDPSSAKPEIKTQILLKSLEHMHINCSMNSVLCWIGICAVKGYTELFPETWKLAQTCLHCQLKHGVASVSCCPCGTALCRHCLLLGFAASKALAPCKRVLSTLRVQGRSDTARCPQSIARGLYGSFVPIQRLFVQRVTQNFPAWPKNSLLKTTGHWVTTKRRSGWSCESLSQCSWLKCLTQAS